MAARSVALHRKHLHLDKAEDRTATDESSLPWGTGEDTPYVFRRKDPEDSDIEWEELADIPFLYLANLPSRARLRMPICGKEMDVCKTDDGVKGWRGCQTNPSEIALYERPDPTKPFLELVGVYPVIEDLHS